MRDSGAVPTHLPLGALLDAVRGVTWPARRPVHRRGAPGTHVSRLTGASPEFTAYRPYRQGDDPRRLDWKLLARTDRAFLRITSDRATVGTVFVVDASASMAFPEPGRDKWALAVRIAVGLAAVALASGDPVGLVISGERVRLAPPRTRRGTVGELARLLGETEPGGAAALTDAVDRAPHVPRVVLVSDFLGADGQTLLRAARARLAAGDDVQAVHVVAREELDPPERAVLAVDPERPTVERALGEETRAGYLAAFGVWREQLARDWRAAGAALHPVVTGEDPATAVRRIAHAALEAGVEAVRA
ncbi:MAG TPA: DUF58 domain-containing protein [Gemmatimonadaceae bacterium]|nr:DUF58 domain-containing protein [Gemmatimonadaceae bacterium]